jgi:hypothetical protein
MLELALIYTMIGVILGSFKYRESFKHSESRGIVLKLEAIGCIFFWPVSLWLEKCFNLTD